MIDFIIVALFIIAAVAFAIVGTLLFRKKFGHEHLSKHNDVAGFIYAVTGVIYAVLMAFVVLVVWEEHQEAHNIIEDEANSISSLQAISKGFSPDFTSELNLYLNEYLNVVTNEDWVLMASRDAINKRKSMPSDESFSRIRTLLYNYQPLGSNDEILLDKAIDKLEDLAENRRMRFFATKLTVPGFMWFVLIIGGILTIIYSMLFSSSNLWAQLTMITILSISISLVLLLIYALDHPFVGIIKIEPDSLLNLIK